MFLSLTVLVSCQDERRDIVPLFEGLTSTPGNQFTFQPQPAVPGLEITSPSPSPSLQSFKAVPIGETGGEIHLLISFIRFQLPLLLIVQFRRQFLIPP